MQRCTRCRWCWGMGFQLRGATLTDHGFSSKGVPDSGRRGSWFGGSRDVRPGALLTAVLLALEGGMVMLPVAATAAGADLPAATNCSAKLLPGLGGQGSNAV